MIVEILQEIRYDEMVFKHYGNLDNFEKVLEINEHLLYKMFLEVGDKVKLPIFIQANPEVREIKIQALWD